MITYFVKEGEEKVYGGANHNDRRYEEKCNAWDGLKIDADLGGNTSILKFDGTNVVVNQDAVNKQKEDALNQNKANLKQMCTIYQEHTFGVDTNFYAMLMHIQDMTDKPKCQAVLDATDALWQDYYVQKGKLEAGEEYSTDFSSHGVKPYSFAECRAEIQGI